MVDLGPAREPRLNQMADVVIRNFFAVEPRERRQFRPWTDERQVSFQNVDQLGQFVEAGAAQEPSRLGHRVVGPVGVVMPIVVVRHTSEFQNLNQFVSFADAFLDDKDGAAIVKLDGDNDKRVDQEREGEKNERKREVHHALQGVISGARRARDILQKPVVAQKRYRHPVEDVFVDFMHIDKADFREDEIVEMRQDRFNIFVSQVDSDDRNVFRIDFRDNFVPEAVLVRAVEVDRRDEFEVVDGIVVDFIEKLFHLFARADENSVVRPALPDKEQVAVHPPGEDNAKRQKEVNEENSLRHNQEERHEVEEDHRQSRVGELSARQRIWQPVPEDDRMFLVKAGDVEDQHPGNEKNAERHEVGIKKVG